jgi:PhnB protein
MAMKLNPYLSFEGQAREAMEFYRDVLGGQLVSSTFGEYGASDQPFADQVMHSQLETDEGFTLMGADTPPGQEHRLGNNVAVSLSGDDADRLRGYWQRLSDGGVVTVPLEMQMWGDEFGMCQDRFGIQWLVNIAGQGSGGAPTE